jgi:hypothetical protein
MNDTARWLDGNALGGLLQQLFGLDLTDTARTCQSCGATRAAAAHRLYHGSSMVLRCPACSDVALVVATLPNRRIVHLAGTWRIEFPDSAGAKSG